LKSINEDDLENILYNFFIKKLKNQSTYKELLSIFEIPMLKAGQKVYKSQLQISNKLNINRITLRKKLDKYFHN
jgi:DNA-binding protein Fis